MAIVSFWSDYNRETAQTLSLIAIATHMSIEHNYRILIVDANSGDETISKCYWKNMKESMKIKKELNRGKLDIASGTEGLLSAVASNKTSPEIIANFTKVVFRNRLDVLLGLNEEFDEHEKSLLLYTDLLKAANKYYDLVIVDLPKTLERESVQNILQLSDVIMYTIPQNLSQIQYFIEKKDEFNEIFGGKIIPLLTNVNNNCKYNPKNVANVLKNKNMGYIYYNNVFLEKACEAGISDFFLKTRITDKAFDQNSVFIESVENTSKKIMDKFEEIKYGKMMQI